MVAPHECMYIQRDFSFPDNFLVEDRGAGQERFGFVVARSGEAARVEFSATAHWWQAR